MARSNLTAHSCAEIQPARETCAKNRIVALRAAIADGRYRVDSEAIANKLVTAIHSHTKSADRRH